MHEESIQTLEKSDTSSVPTRYLDSRQAAKYLGFASGTVLALWRKRGYGPPYIKMGARSKRSIRYYYEVADLDAWMREQKLHPANRHDLRDPPAEKPKTRPKRSYTRSPKKPTLDPHLVFRK